MRTLLVGLVALTLAGISHAAEPTARERVEGILTDTAADLTAEVNALLVLGPERVRPVLDNLFVRMKNKHAPASGYRAETESLVAILGGIDEAYKPPVWDLGSRFGVLDGVVLRFDIAPDGGGWSGNLHYSWKPPKDPLRGIEVGWREPIAPDPSALLRRILDPDEDLKAQFGGWWFPRSVAQALGTAARTDPNLAARLVAAYRDRSSDRDSAILFARALAWLGTPAAVEALTGSLDGFLRERTQGALWFAGQLGGQLRRADGAALAGLRAKYAREDPVALAAFDDVVGGDATDRPLLARATAKPSPESIGALRARMARFNSWVMWPEPDVILESFRLGLSLAETDPEELQRPATDLLRSILRVDTAGGVQVGVREIARVVGTDLAAGRLLPRSCPGPAWGPFADTVDTEDAREPVWGEERLYPTLVDRGYGRFLECNLRRDPKAIALVIRNRGDRTVVVNRVGLAYGETQGEPGEDFLRIDLGRPPLNDLAGVPVAAFEEIGPGSAYEVRWPLPEDVPADARIIVAFKDWFVADGDLPGIRLVSFEKEYEPEPIPPRDAHLVVRPVDRDGVIVADSVVQLFAEPIAAGWSRSQGYLYFPRESFPDEDAWGGLVAGESRFVERLNTGLWRLVVRAPGHAPTERMLATARGVTPDDLEVVVEPAARLSGRLLLDGETPLADVEVAAIRVGTSIKPSSETFDFRARTDWAGRYRLEEMAGGDYDLFTRIDGQAWIAGPRVRLPDIDRFDVALPTGAVISGTVTAEGETSEPIRGARIELLPNDEQEPLLGWTETDEEGHYVLRTHRRFVSFGGIRVLAAEHARKVVPGPEGTVLRDGERREVDIRLSPDARIGGTVTSSKGFLPGADVRVWFPSDSGYHRNPDRFEALVTKTDALGNWSVGGLPPGDVAVQVVLDGYLQPGWEEKTTASDMRVPRGHFPGPSVRTLVCGVNPDFDVEMVGLTHDERKAHSLRGVILDRRGKPVPLARIVVSGGEETLSDVEGHFEVMGFSRLGIEVSKPGYASAWPEWEPGHSGSPEPIRLVLARRPMIRGRVVSRTGGNVAGAAVHVGRKLVRKMRYAYADWEIVPGTTVAADGSFAIPVPALEVYHTPWSSEYADEFVVCVEADGHAAGLSAPFSLGAESRDVTLARPIELHAGVVLEGCAIRYGADRPAAGVPVFVEPAEGAWNEPGWPPAMPPSPGRVIRAVTDAEGWFRIPYLVPGGYEVGLTPPGRSGDAREVTLPADVPVRLHVRTLHALAGTVTGPKADPLPGAKVRLEDENGDLRSFPGREVTGPDGRFRFVRVPAGPWHVVVTTDAALGPQRIGPVPAGKTDIAITLPRPQRITGRLLAPDGRPMEDVDVYGKPTPPNLPGARATTNEEGRFELWRLGNFPYDIEIEDLFVTVRRVPAGGHLEYRSRGTESIIGRVRRPNAAEDDGWPNLRLVPLDPEPDPRILRHPHTWVTDDGKFEFEHLPPGRYRLVLDEDSSKDWKLLSEPVIEAGAKDVEAQVISVRMR